MPTDTIYGIVGQALNPKTVERIYRLRKRSPQKPCIVLVADLKQIEIFGFSLTLAQKESIQKFEGPTSFIIECPTEKFAYLHRGTHTLALRIPQNESLRKLLEKSGPLLAPSANPAGQDPSRTIAEAKNYFGAGVDLYVDGGEILGAPSQVIRLREDGASVILRG